MGEHAGGVPGRGGRDGFRHPDDYRAARGPLGSRPAEVDQLVADSSKAREELGWVPKTDFSTIVELMVKADMEEGLS